MQQNRFAAGLSRIKEASGKVTPATPTLAPVPAVTTQEPAAKRSAEPAPSRQGKVAISAYFDPTVRQQLAILAVKDNRSQAALMAEALNLLFEKYGEPTIARA